MRHCRVRGCAIALAGILWTSASFAQVPTQLDGWFQLPPMCSSVAAICALTEEPLADGEAAARRFDENFRFAESSSGFYVREREGGYLQIEVFSFNGRRNPMRRSEGLWWMRAEDVEFFQGNYRSPDQ
jgi:hypothetical protein